MMHKDVENYKNTSEMEVVEPRWGHNLIDVRQNRIWNKTKKIRISGKLNVSEFDTIRSNKKELYD